MKTLKVEVVVEGDRELTLHFPKGIGRRFVKKELDFEELIKILEDHDPDKGAKPICGTMPSCCSPIRG